jgi:hypothetical protein
MLAGADRQIAPMVCTQERAGTRSAIVSASGGKALLETSQECISSTVEADRSGHCSGQLRSQAT